MKMNNKTVIAIMALASLFFVSGCTTEVRYTCPDCPVCPDVRNVFTINIPTQQLYIDCNGINRQTGDFEEYNGTVYVNDNGHGKTYEGDDKIKIIYNDFLAYMNLQTPPQLEGRQDIFCYMRDLKYNVTTEGSTYPDYLDIDITDCQNNINCNIIPLIVSKLR